MTIRRLVTMGQEAAASKRFRPPKGIYDESGEEWKPKGVAGSIYSDGKKWSPETPAMAAGGNQAGGIPGSGGGSDSFLANPGEFVINLWKKAAAAHGPTLSAVNAQGRAASGVVAGPVVPNPNMGGGSPTIGAINISGELHAQALAEQTHNQVFAVVQEMQEGATGVGGGRSFDRDTPP
jgi:hypothetical protein